jgi:chemotaxis protein MotB
MPKGDQTELLVKERGSHGIAAWLVAAVFAGFSGYLYMMVYRPLQEESRKRKQELTEQRALARDAKREVDEVKAALEKSQAETKQVRDDLMQTAEAKDENAKLLAKLQKEVAESGVELSGEGGRITVTMVDKILFNSGEADLTDHGEALLRKLGGVLKTNLSGKIIQVNGHTDKVPIKTELKDLYPTNWELSAARAINVVRFLQDEVKIDPRKMMAAGYSQYHPIASNSSTTGKAKNRRIEILLLPDRMKLVKGEFADAAGGDGAVAKTDKKAAPAAKDKERLARAAAVRQKQKKKK